MRLTLRILGVQVCELIYEPSTESDDDTDDDDLSFDDGPVFVVGGLQASPDFDDDPLSVTGRRYVGFE